MCAALQHFCYVSYSDVNECTADPSVCSHFCINLFASFRCSCPLGHVLSSNNRTCEGEALTCLVQWSIVILTRTCYSSDLTIDLSCVAQITLSTKRFDVNRTKVWFSV